MDKKQRNAEYFKKWYAANKDTQYKRIQDRKNRIRDEVRAYKESHPCADCNNFFKHYILDFNHLDPSTKLYNVAELMNNGSIKKVWEEIAKCNLLCANCHRERTYGENSE